MTFDDIRRPGAGMLALMGVAACAIIWGTTWYAITWQTLDRHTGYDAGAVEGFQRSAYRHLQQDSAPRTAPSRGVGTGSPAPSGGAVEGGFACSSTPSRGDHLEKPSVAAGFGAAGCYRRLTCRPAALFTGLLTTTH